MLQIEQETVENRHFEVLNDEQKEDLLGTRKAENTNKATKQ